jgi:hypothetical protein
VISAVCNAGCTLVRPTSLRRSFRTTTPRAPRYDLSCCRPELRDRKIWEEFARDARGRVGMKDVHARRG